jgi:hypothetical protein
MDNLFAELLEQNTPKTNPYIMNSIATVYMKDAEEYIDNVFKSAARSFPKGLEYLGYEVCTPQEEYNMVTKVRNNERTFDLAKSDLYTVRYKFNFEGKRIPDRFIYIPYVDDGGIIHLNGTRYHVTPVLSDKVISPSHDNIFVRLLRDKIIFRVCYQTIVVNGESKPCNVVWSRIYRRKATSKNKVPNTTEAVTTVAHYLFAKYGFTEAFRKFAGFVPVVGESDINFESYPEECWTIVQSTQVKPRTYIGENYFGSNIRLAIPNDKWNPATENLVAGFFYIVDHFPTRFNPTMLDIKGIWMILMGHIVFSGNFGENRLHDSISEHFVSLNDYVDDSVKNKLKEIGYNIEDFYDLLALIMMEFNDLVMKSGNNSTSMYGKNLEVLYYMLLTITSGIFLMSFDLGKIQLKRPVTEKDVEKMMNQKLKPRAIFDITNNGIILENVSYSGDSKYATLTSKIVEQEGSSGGKRGKPRRAVVGENKHIDTSMVEAGSILYLSKNNPTPTNRINPYVNIDISTGTILPNPKFVELIHHTTNLLKGKIKLADI